MTPNWDHVAIAPADILLPSPCCNLSAWAVVACDQYTSQPDYWESVETMVGDNPSALRITLPEIYLHESGARVPQIHQAMSAYLQDGTLHTAVKNGFILTERTTESGARLGLVAAVDLDSYDFNSDARSMVRATEGTILSRIPPRLAVRQGASLESPHVLLLLDDYQKTVIEPLYKRRNDLSKLYDFELMAGGGCLRGWAVTEPDLLQGVYESLEKLKQKLPADNPLLMAVGDGNHSLATAKAHWLNIKSGLTQKQAEKHPARYALVEIENIHDDALLFHPIHRVLFHADGEALLRDWTEYCNQKGMILVADAQHDNHSITMIYQNYEKIISIQNPESSLPVGTLQKYLDDYLIRHQNAEIDYIHGDETVLSLCKQPDTVGFLVPGLEKSALLPAVRKDGALPRKTFSMGEAHEKRYYMECRQII